MSELNRVKREEVGSYGAIATKRGLNDFKKS